MVITRSIQIIAGIAGLVALLLGLAFWIANIDLISIHMLFGLVVALGLLVMSILATSVRGIRLWGIVGIVYALLVPVFGLTQSGLLVGNLHWLIETAHMLFGIGAMVLTGILGTRYITLKRAIIRTAADAQAVR